jgi:tellurite resistance protein
METRDAFKERERAAEAAYFHAQDAKLLEQIRTRATLGDIAAALGEKLQVDDPALIAEARDLGLTAETGPAALLVPLVIVAWAEGGVKPTERAVVLELASARGIEAGSPAYDQLMRWLENRPPDALMDVALKAIRIGLSVLPPEERDESIRRYVDACREVAMATGGFPGLFGMGGKISDGEASLIDSIIARLRSTT